jgi:hypothetical protein
MRPALFREIVNVMKNDQQRRFLKRDAATGRYFEVSEIVAQAKVGQVRLSVSFLILILVANSEWCCLRSATSTLSLCE